jgi:hypothetical protein
MAHRAYRTPSLPIGEPGPKRIEMAARPGDTAMSEQHRARLAPSGKGSRMDIGEIKRIIEIERIDEGVPVRDPLPTPTRDPDAVPA